MKVTVTAPPPTPTPRAGITIELSLSDARKLTALLGQYRLPQVSESMDRLFNMLWEAGAFSDDGTIRKADADLKQLYGNK